MMELWLLLLPVAAASGWLAAKSGSRRRDASGSDMEKSPAYFQGLNYLLNEQPDKAIDVFVQMLEVDSDTVETHLALGSLFRRRGEVDRAIRIHQNLIARPTLNRGQRAQALLELGQDYMRAGLFDRAESLFTELFDMNLYSEQALRNLLIIYQREKDWDNCLTVANHLESFTSEPLAKECAHYYCELAEIARDSRDYSRALALVKRAQNSDRGCVRAIILQGDMEMARGEFKAAIRTFKRVEQQDPELIHEVMPRLVESHTRLERRGELLTYLRQLFMRHKNLPSMLALLDHIQQDDGDQAAADFLIEYLRDHPTLEGLSRLIGLNLWQVDGSGREVLPILREQVGLLLQKYPAYQCVRCGFSAKTMHWQCPSCSGWDSVKPLLGVAA